MPASKKSESQKRPRGRPMTRVIKLPASSPEQAARTFFSGVKRPDPSLRIRRQKKPTGAKA